MHALPLEAEQHYWVPQMLSSMPLCALDVPYASKQLQAHMPVEAKRSHEKFSTVCSLNRKTHSPQRTSKLCALPQAPSPPMAAFSCMHMPCNDLNCSGRTFVTSVRPLVAGACRSVCYMLCPLHGATLVPDCSTSRLSLASISVYNALRHVSVSSWLVDSSQLLRRRVLRLVESSCCGRCRHLYSITSSPRSTTHHRP
jgi:hypothetical protein